MAAPTNTFKTFEQVGRKEDLADMIYDISPTDTPLLSNFKRGKATNTLHEWMTDELAAGTHNAAIEGDDTAATAASPTVRMGNYTQISKKVPQVSGTANESDTAGRASEMAYQVAKMGKELKRDIETTLGGMQGGAAGNATTARECASVVTFLDDNAVGSITVAAHTSGVPTTDVSAGAAAAFTEAQLKTALANAWNEGGDPNMVIVGSSNKQVASGFTGIATQYKDNKQSPAAIIGAADVYVSDFGEVSIVADRFVTATNVLVLETDKFSVDYLRPMSQKPLAKTGDSEKRQILAEFTLRAENPKGSAVIGTTT